jgi:hypothetical protein
LWSRFGLSARTFWILLPAGSSIRCQALVRRGQCHWRGSPFRGATGIHFQDKYTKQAIKKLALGYIAFAGQRDDGFYSDVESIFDLVQLRNPGKDSQGGFNIHLMALSIPVSELGGDMQSVGVYATTSRRQVMVLDHDGDHDRDDGRVTFGRYVQVGRQGNPLFNEALVAVVDKDLYSRTSPMQDKALFSKYALTPELAHLLNVLVFGGHRPAPETNRMDSLGESGSRAGRHLRCHPAGASV